MTPKTGALVIGGLSIAAITMVVGLNSCHTEGGSGFLTESCGVEHWRPSDLPLPLIIASDAHALYAEEVERARMRWGAQYFLPPLLGEVEGAVEEPIAADPYVYVTIGDEALTGHTRLTWTDDCRIAHAIIELPYNAEPAVMQRAIEHELGHSLGLAHDSSSKSVMYFQAIEPGGEIPEADRTRLRLQYGK